MIAHCENAGDRMAILDAPPDLLPQEILEWRMNTAGYDSKMAALYYPWIEVMDPLTNRPMMIPPSGHVAGVWCRTDGTRGVHKAPANEVVMGANGLGFQVTHAEQGGLNKVGINCIRAFSGRGIRIWGARTLSSDPEWRYINVRRLFNFVAESIMEGTQWSVFEPNDERLWKQLEISASNFLRRVWSDGALFGSDPSQAFYVKCDAETNPPEVDRGRPGRLRDRHRAGEAGRVRDLPPQPVHRRRRRRDQRVIFENHRKERLRWQKQKEVYPIDTFKVTLGGAEAGGLFNTVSGISSSIDPTGFDHVDGQRQAAGGQDAGQGALGRRHVLARHGQGHEALAVALRLHREGHRGQPQGHHGRAARHARAATVLTWSLTNAWPSSYHGLGAGRLRRRGRDRADRVHLRAPGAQVGGE